eukprot:4701888-Prorocentrum_lima.AAC.1
MQHISKSADVAHVQDCPAPWVDLVYAKTCSAGNLQSTCNIFSEQARARQPTCLSTPALSQM